MTVAVLKVGDKAAAKASTYEGEERAGASIARDPITGSWCVIGAARVVVVERVVDGVTYSEIGEARKAADRGDAD